MPNIEASPAPASQGASPPPLELEVFRAGDYGARGVYGVDDLDAIAAAYDPARHEAPLTLDHAQAGPAHGWVEKLERRGDALVATIRGASPYVRNAIALGYYKKPSVELYPKGEGRDAASLRAVSLLGAGVPEVKGLAPAEESDDAIPFEPAPNADAIATAATAAAAAASTSSGTAAPEPSNASAPIAPAFDPEPLIERLRRAGKYLPAWDRAGLPEFLRWLGAQASPAAGAVAFAEDGQAPVAWFAEFLGGLDGVALGAVAEPPRESSARRRAALNPQFGLPMEGGRSRLSPESIALHDAASRMIEEEPSLGYAEALRRAAREGAADGKRRRTL